jgi:hypothetical protein
VSAPPGTLSLLDGRQLSGQLVGLGEPGVVWQAEGEPLTFTWAAVRQFQTSQLTELSPPAVWLEWLDGSYSVGQQLTTNDQEVVVQQANGDSIRAPLNLLRRVRFGASGTAGEGPWQALTAPQETDVLVIRRSSGALDQIRGTLLSITDSAVRFDLGDQQVDAPRQKLEGFALRQRPNPPQMPVSIARLRLADGAEWHVASFPDSAQTDAVGPIRCLSPAGLSVEVLLDDIVELRPLGNEYSLGELEIARTDYTPFVALNLPPELVATALGPQLRDGGQSLRMVGGGRMEFRLPAGLRTLHATLTPLTEGGRSKSELRIAVDDNERFRKEVLIGDLPTPIEVAVDGGRRLVIELSYGDDGDAGDVLYLRDARVVK